MKHLLFLAAGAALTLMAVVSCGEIPEVSGNDADNTYKPLELSTKAAGFVKKGGTFTFDFIDRINKEADEDFVVSPLSMQFLLGMLLDGANGETAAQIAKVLGYGAGEVDEVNKFCLSMLQQLPNLDNKTKLNIANAIFLDDGWPLNDSFRKDVSKFFEAEVSNLNFMDNEASLKAINGWCSKQTEGLIPQVIDNVDPGILAYLMNAVYFKSQWVYQFSKDATSDEIFTDESGAVSTVKMMKQNSKVPYHENDRYKMVRLPYGNGAFSMIILLPKDNCKVSDITAELKKADWNLLRSRAAEKDVDLWIPKFETKFKIKLNDILSEMGMPRAFSGADFSAMSPAASSLSFVQQDAVIKVDEEGSEAAAVSVAAIEKGITSIGSEKPIFHADHPFIYIITEQSTGAVLFAGRYSGK
ncbi:MAG: serpin family protein [Bacteroidales bacterium]|nr:serpin family protein [Bacteroidales bacterium]